MQVGAPARTKWLVGSSNRRKEGFRNSARARATRIRQPPLKSLHFFDCMAVVNPRPCKILPAAKWGGGNRGGGQFVGVRKGLGLSRGEEMCVGEDTHKEQSEGRRGSVCGYALGLHNAFVATDERAEGGMRGPQQLLVGLQKQKKRVGDPTPGSHTRTGWGRGRVHVIQPLVDVGQTVRDGNGVIALRSNSKATSEQSVSVHGAGTHHHRKHPSRPLCQHNTPLPACHEPLPYLHHTHSLRKCDWAVSLGSTRGQHTIQMRSIHNK